MECVRCSEITSAGHCGPQYAKLSPPYAQLSPPNARVSQHSLFRTTESQCKSTRFLYLEQAGRGIERLGLLHIRPLAHPLDLQSFELDVAQVQNRRQQLPDLSHNERSRVTYMP
eukprot:2804486-Rhodomonas_salina.1